jgi:chromosome segregation ATPase
MDASRTSKKEIATRVKEKIFETNEAELTIGAAKKKLAQNQQLLDKTDASYVTLRRIDNACKEQKIFGYRGLLIDQLDLLESRFNAVIDIAGKAKLFSIIVDDLVTA